MDFNYWYEKYKDKFNDEHEALCIFNKMIDENGPYDPDEWFNRNNTKTPEKLLDTYMKPEKENSEIAMSNTMPGYTINFNKSCKQQKQSFIKRILSLFY